MLTDFRLGRLDIRMFLPVEPKRSLADLTKHALSPPYFSSRTEIVLASYDLVRTHIDEFDDLALSVIFLDEAHKIKNHAANITKAYARFHCQVRFGLTVS